MYYCWHTFLQTSVCFQAQVFDDTTNTFGIMKKEKYVTKSDFKMEFITTVEALENTGYIIDVTREVDNQKRLVCIPLYVLIVSIFLLAVQEMLFHNVFLHVHLLSKSFQSGGLVCTFSDRDMAEYIKHKKTLFHESHPQNIKKAVSVIGKQPDSDIYVFGPDAIFDDTEIRGL